MECPCRARMGRQQDYSTEQQLAEINVLKTTLGSTILRDTSYNSCSEWIQLCSINGGGGVSKREGFIRMPQRNMNLKSRAQLF